jgi:uncharacterized membrane protein YidH (DUF202 family)
MCCYFHRQRKHVQLCMSVLRYKNSEEQLQKKTQRVERHAAILIIYAVVLCVRKAG